MWKLVRIMILGNGILFSYLECVCRVDGLGCVMLVATFVVCYDSLFDVFFCSLLGSFRVLFVALEEIYRE